MVLGGWSRQTCPPAREGWTLFEGRSLGHLGGVLCYAAWIQTLVLLSTFDKSSLKQFCTGRAAFGWRRKTLSI
jgi:hypothetical protein